MQHLIEMDNGSTSTASNRELCLPCADRGTEGGAPSGCLMSWARMLATPTTPTSLCRNCLYVLTARRLGWPVRGCDVGGYPNDPDHPWNAT